ncbi:MAG: hypothetical protein QXL43_02185 [Methanolinea sp.]
MDFKVALPFTPPPTSTTITLTPQAEGLLVSPDGRYSVYFPAGSVLSNVDVTLRPLQASMLPSGAEPVQASSSIFAVEGLAGLLAKPATVRVKYSGDDLRVAGGDASALGLARFDAGTNAWTILPTERSGDTLVAQSDRMGVWAVVHAPGGAGVPGMVPGTLVIVGGIVGVVVLVLVVVALRRKKAPI